MNSQDPSQSERQIFSEALAKATTNERNAYLDAACGKNARLRQRVEELLLNHATSDSFMADPAVEMATLLIPTNVSEGPGTRIGRYKLLQQIGEGGMGIVYMAEQEEPVRRRVALKVIKLGMDTRQVIARFEAERQALAMMDHPNIAKVLDGGATETGRLYFVMELVQGVPITEFCDKAKLAAKERLKLFISVCQAVQHAHQKGIIHRDIKPSNVLVTLHDGVPVPKVIDFGIAKATNQKLTEKTLFTNFAMMIGTPAYMSPEQAEMSGLDVDTRTDIYALGVLLYQLLTGTTPFPEKRLRSLAYGEMQRVILEEEPERPSTRLSTMTNEQKTAVARNCGEEPESLTNLLRGDLDWIAMKCIEKDRTRRYETASGLATDIQRHLNDEVVAARPPSAVYRFRKMVRRNKGAATATAAIVFTLIAALVFSTAAFVRERTARLRAATAERGREAANREAESESVRANTISTFVSEFLDGAMPDLDLGGHYDGIRRLLEKADQLAAGLTNAPQAEVEIRSKIGAGYFTFLQDFAKGEQQVDTIDKLAERLGNDGKDLARYGRFARAMRTMWERGDTNAITSLVKIGGDALTKHPPDTSLAGYAFGNVASFYSFSGQLEKAESLALQTLNCGQATNDTTHLGIRMFASEVLMRIHGMRGAIQDSEIAAAQLMSPLKLPYKDESLKEGRLLSMFLGAIKEGDRFHIPEKALILTLDEIPAERSLTRGHLEGLLGCVIVRRGDWESGVARLLSSVTNSTCDVGIWNAATLLSALTGDVKMHRSLIAFGLTQFGNGANAESSRLLLEPILSFEPDSSFLPAIRHLVDRIGQPSVPPWTRKKGAIPRALFAYHTGRYHEASTIAGEALPAPPEKLKPGLDPYWAGALFVRSMAETRLNHTEQARAAYQEGLRLHSPALRGPGRAYTGNEWAGACEAELLRRQAASLLGEAVQ
jgi:serine/threonine protein kinase/tetratricopeptide (TPR) repeat protein